MWTRWPGCAKSQIISAPDPRRSPAKTGPAAGQVRFSSCRAPHFLQTKKTGPSTGKIRSFWWARVDSNHRSIKQQIYSLSPLATREHALILFLSSGRIGWRLVYFTTASGVCQPVFSDFLEAFFRRPAPGCCVPPGSWPRPPAYCIIPMGFCQRPISILFALRPRVWFCDKFFYSSCLFSGCIL